MKLLNQVSVFSYVTCQRTPNYRAIMDCFIEAKDRYASELRPREVIQCLRSGSFTDLEVVQQDQVEKDLESLLGWGNLSRRHDASEVSTISDFYRPHWIYSTTPIGEKAHRAVIEVEATVGRHGSLKIQTLKSIQRVLGELLEILKAQGRDDGLPSRLDVLFNDFWVLEEESSHFLNRIQMFEKDTGEDAERFRLNKQAVISYVSHFYEEVHAVHRPIETMVRQIETLGVRAMLERAAAHQELPPSIDKIDPKEAWIERVMPKWTGIFGWVVTTEKSEARVAQLGRAAGNMVSALLRSLTRVNERVSRKIDREADFLLLAEWFSGCRDDDASHDLARLAFGIHPSRHMHLLQEDPSADPPGTPWQAATPVDLPEALRTRGKVNRQGRISQVPDYSQSKAWCQQQLLQELEATEKAADYFVSRGEFQVADLGPISSNQLQFLLFTIGIALTGEREGDTFEEVSEDGRFLCRLTKPKVEILHRLQTEDGAFRLPNFTIMVEPVGSVRVSSKMAL